MEFLHNITMNINKLKLFYFILLYSWLLNCFRSEYLVLEEEGIKPLLPKEEVQILQMISLKLRNKYWNLSPSSCTNDGDFNKTISPNIFSEVNCDCSHNNNSVCHVTRIRLKGLNLTGELPAEFAKLNHLGDINLSHNYIGGTIPRAFGQLSVSSLSLLGNRIHGLIPPELANVTTLEELLLEDNLLEGPIPQNFGSLIGLRRFTLSANKFNGTIPETFGNLKNLMHFRIDGNEFSGKIPDFIGNWTNITILDLQGTGLEGPIPLSISHLKNLTELRISDLSGTNSIFPDLKDMQSMNVLILKNCLINGAIPEYIGGFSQLKILDLSFNRLTGHIPDSMGPLNLKLQFLFLSNNSLTGEIPSWITGSEENFDLSYNNFTRAADYNCQPSKVNLVSSMSSLKSNSVAWCLKKDLPCPREPKYHSLFINCGGTTVDWEGHEYEEDLVAGGPSYFSYYSSEKWAYSSTGVYLNNDKGNFVTINNNMTEAIYRTARLAPSSLKYYGLCLRTGSYNVRLHFAEIQYTDDMTYNSIGRRIFDVSIQGKVVRKNFNIAEEAKGFGKGITLDNDVTVDNGTLEIHLYWAGKGTTLIPDRGVYGPLISAIAVTPNFHIEPSGLSGLAIAGTVVGSVVILLILFVLWKNWFRVQKDVEDKELRRAIELRTAYFSLKQIKAATNDFDSANKIGEGGFGPVYKGVLPDKAVIAVKQLSSKSKQGTREFINEIGMIVAVQHPNLVKLFGCCIEENQLLLIYEYMENNSLAKALFGREEQLLNLDWPSRKKIFLQIARGLTYLHEESRLKIVHRDIKSANVLLDRDLNAKICDFGLAKLNEEEKTHVSTRIAGTIGYMAPEYAMRGYLTDKADVYSFGIVALEIVSGKNNNNFRPIEEFMNLLDWAYVLLEQGNLLDLVDPILGSNYSKKEALRMLNLALMCTNPSPTLRPSMSTVISKFEGNKKVRAPVVQTTTEHDMDFKSFNKISMENFKSFDKISMDSQTQSCASSQESREERTMSMSDPCLSYSMSARSKDDTDMDNYTPKTKLLQSA